MTEVDELFQSVQEGDPEAFASWVRLCETPLRKSLRRFASLIDVEAELQEGLLRMWQLAPRKTLKGENASLRFALTLVRNLAISETRRLGREVPTDLGDPPADPGAPADPGVLQAIRDCLDKLPRSPRAALLARLRGGPDRDLAVGVRMKVNTFLQNIVRAREFMAECLRGAGVRIEDYL